MREERGMGNGKEEMKGREGKRNRDKLVHQM